MAISEFTRERARKTREKNIEKTRYDEETGIRMDSGNDEYYKKAWENYKRVKASDLAPKVAGGTVNPIISFGNVRENPVLKRKTNTTKTYSQALTESRNKAKVLENGAKLPTVIPPKGDVSKLILPDTGGGGTVNPTLKRNEVRTNYDYMTDREAAVYKYYRDRGQVEKAQEYLDALEMDVNQRAAMQKREDAKKLAEESTAAALYARAVGNIGQAAGAVYAAAMEGADKPVDPYHPLMGGVNMNEGLYEGLMGQSTGANKVFKDIGLGIFDWGTQAALLGPATPYVMAAGAAAGNTKDALERGGTTDEAVMYGLAGGAAEAITEKLGYDRLFELGKITKNKGAVSTFLKSLLPQAASEGAEEATSEIANILADTLIMGDNSQMKQIAQTAMENGATESEAVKTALQQGFLQVIYSGAIGAASGGVIAGGIGGLSRAKGRNALEMAGNPAGVAREAMTNAGKEVTKRINDMRSQGKAEVPEGTTQGNVLPEQGNVMGNSENTSMEQRQENKALRDFGEKYYYTEGQKVVNEEAERRGDTSFIPAFQTYYTAGLTGVKESDIKQTAETIVADKGLLRAAYLAGVNDRKEDLEARMKGTGKMGQTAGVFLETDAVTEDQLSFIKAVSKVAELEAVLVEELPEDRRGYYENNKGRITIAVNSGQFAGTVFHELSHYIREANPEGFDRMRQAVFSAAAAMKGMDTEAYIKSYEKRYGEAYREAGQEAGYDVILEEMTADMLGELAGDEKSLRAFLEELNRENPTVLGKIREFVESLLKTLKGLVNDGRFSSFSEELKKDIDFTERLAKMLAEETKKAGEMQRGENAGKGKGKDTEKKLSKKIGGVFPEINVSVEDFKQMGISEKSLNNLKVIEEKVYQYLSGKFLSEGNREKPILNLDTGMEVCVYRGGINETFRKDAYYKNLSSEWKKIKLAAMMHMDMLIKYGEIREKEAANYHNEKSTTRFAYLTAPILVGGKPYTVDIDIKRTDRGDRFHVHKIKIADSSAQAARMRPVFEVELSAEQIIAQDNGKDNGKGRESGKRFSFAGERARTADREKLDMAKKMEEEGKTRREIYDKTGWFRGADDKWRFEIDDSQMQYRYAGVPGLSAYLQNTELFEAYPELRNVTIKFEKLKDGVKGVYNGEKNEITLDESLKEAPGTVLLHEIQHAIQKIEGHANGANREYWERRIEEGFDARTAEEKAKEWNLKKQMEELKRKNPEFYQDMQELDSMVPTIPRGRIDWETLEEIEPDPIEWQLYDQRREQLEEKYGVEMVWDYIDLKYELDQSRKGNERTAFDLYYATAGEIEARDTEKRMHFTKEDRKKWFPNIGDEDTVFAEGVRFSIKEDTEGRELSEGQQKFFAESKAVDSRGRLLTLYHQTGNDFTIFEPRRKGAGTSDTETPFGIFLKTTANDIGLKGKKQMELYANIKNPLVATTREDLKWKMQRISDDYEKISQEEQKLNFDYRMKYEAAGKEFQEYVAEWRKKNPNASRQDIYQDEKFQEKFDAEDRIAEEWEEAAANFALRAKEVITKMLENKGYDGIILKEDKGSFGRKTDAYIALHPEQVKRIDNLNPTDDTDIRFSIREEAYDALVEENEALKEANEALSRQFEITKDAVHDPVSAKKAVRKWLKAHDSEYDVDDFTEKFVALADYVANAGDRVDFQKVMGALQKLAYDALSESKVLNTDLSDAYKDFKNEVRKTKIKVTDSMLEELEYYGGYIEFRKRNFGKLNLSRQSGIPADVFYQEMAEKYPGLLKEGNVKTQVDILIDLANTVDSLQPIYENPYGMNLDEYAMDAAYDLWEMYFDIEMQKPTFADKYEKKVEQLQIENQKLKAAKNKMRQEMKERHEEQMEKARAEANKRLAAEREKYIHQVDVLLEEKYKLRQKLETQWKAHKNSMVEAQRTELARLIAEGKKTAAEIRELKKDKKELKQRMDEVLEREDLWVQACQAILRENNKEINRYKKQVQRLKESKEKQRERAIRKYDRLLEAKFQLQDRQKKQSERRKYAKYRRVVEQETNKMLKWITKPTDTYHVPEEMTKGLKELLTKIGTSDGEIMIMQNDLFQAIKDLERFRPKDGKEEADFFVEHDEQTIDSMNEFIGKYPNGFDLENLPADEMKELADILRSIHKRITNANKFISLFRQVEVREVSEKFLSESQKMKNTIQEGRTRQVLDFFNMDLVDPYSFFTGMGDSVRNTLFKATEEGFERKIRHEAEAEKFISGIVAKKEAAAWSTATPTLYKIGGRDIYMTPAEVMSLYATYRRNQGILHLLTGGFKTAFNKLKRMTKKEAETRLENFKPYQPSRKELEDIFNTLTDKQKEVVEKAQDFLSNVVGGWGNETSMEMFGYKKFNDQRYFPISSDKDYINNVFGDPNQKQKAIVNIGMTRPTNDQAKNPIVIEDFFTVFARQIDQMSSYNAFVPVISDWNKFMGYKKHSREEGVQEVESVKKEIVRTMGRGAISYIGKFLDDIQSVNTGEKAPITKTLVSNMKRASVGANLRVAIQQPVSIVRAADMISPKYLMMAFSKGKNDFEKIYEYAPIAQWKEWGHYDMNIARGLEERIRGQSILGKLSDYSMAMASWGDKFTWGRIWKAVEMETRDKYPDLKGERFDRKVGERFSEIINRTQVVDSMLHRSQIMREKTIYKQMTTSFMGEPIKTYNMMRNSIVALMKDNTKENRNKVVRSFVTLTFNAVAVAAAAAVVDALRDDDDDETWAEKWLEAFRGDYEKAESGGEKIMAFLSSNVGQNTNPFTYIPYLKDVFSALQGFTVQRTDIGWVNDIIKSGNVLMQYIQGESPYTFAAVLANTAASLSKATGLPIASAKRDMEAIKNTVINQAMGLEAQYENKKLTYALGSEKNVSAYVKMMIDAKLSGNDKLATRIYNEMVNAGISNEKMESQLGSKEKEKIKKDSVAMEAVEAYAKKDYDTYTQKLDELRKKYSQKNIESAIRSMYKAAYGEDDIETFDTISQEFWEKEEEVESSQFKTVIDAMMEAKLSGKLGEATKLYNYMVNNGLPNDKLDSAIDSREKELLKNDPLIKEGVEAFHEGDADRYVDIVEQLKNKNYYARNVTSAIESMHDKLYGEDDEDTFETITQDFWEEDEADEMVSYELLFNAFWNGSRGTYNEVWGLLNAAGKEDKSIRASMRGKCYYAYWKADGEGDTEKMNKAAEGYQKNGGKLETLLKPPKE